MSPSSLQFSFQEHAPSPLALPWWHLVGGRCMSLPSPWVGEGNTSLKSVGQRVLEPLSGPLLSSRGVERKCRVLAPDYTVHIWSRASQGWACPYKVWHSSQLLTWPCIGPGTGHPILVAPQPSMMASQHPLLQSLGCSPGGFDISHPVSPPSTWEIWDPSRLSRSKQATVTKIRPSSPKYAQMAFYLLWCGSRMLLVRSQVLMGEWVKSLLAFSFVLCHPIPSPVFKVWAQGGINAVHWAWWLPSSSFPQSTGQKEPIKKTLTLCHNVFHPKEESALSPSLDS